MYVKERGSRESDAGRIKMVIEREVEGLKNTRKELHN